VAGLAIWGIWTAESQRSVPGNAESSALRVIAGFLMIALSFVLVAFGLAATRNGRRARYSAGIIGLGSAASALLIGFPTSLVLAVPMGVGAYLLLRAPRP
jgi:hypothetical protein